MPWERRFQSGFGVLIKYPDYYLSLACCLLKMDFRRWLILLIFSFKFTYSINEVSMNIKLNKAILSILGVAATATFAPEAFATSITGNITSSINNAAGFTTGARPTYVWDGGNIGFGSLGLGNCTTNTCGVLPAASQARVGGANSAGSSVQADRLMGWNHTTSWYTFQVTAAGGYTISADRISTDTKNQPAFSVWSSGANAWGAAGLSHHFNQVAAPTASNGNAYMLVGPNPITGFVGYANSGAAFTNADGSSVQGALTFGSSVRDLTDTTSPYNSIVTKGSFTNAHAGAISGLYAGVGSSVNTSNPTLTNANGGGHADLQLYLPLGWYVMTVGGSCADFTCSPTASVTSAYKLKIMSNAGVTAPAAVPVPAAAWLFGPALLSLAGFKRRQQVKLLA